MTGNAQAVPCAAGYVRKSRSRSGGKIDVRVANLVRAFVTVKTHPVLRLVRLEGRALETVKDGYATWQLLEADQ